MYIYNIIFLICIIMMNIMINACNYKNVFAYPMCKKKGVSNAQFGCNLHSGLCIRLSLLSYIGGASFC